MVTFEGCPESLMDTVLFFLAEERSKLREAAADKVAADAAADAAGLPAAAGGSAGSTAAAPVGSGLQLDYQRKVTPSERAVLLADILEDAYEAAQVQGEGAGADADDADALGVAVRSGWHRRQPGFCRLCDSSLLAGPVLTPPVVLVVRCMQAPLPRALPAPPGTSWWWWPA